MVADRKIRALVVDDSVFARVSITKQLAADPEIEVIDTASNGIEALEKIRDLRPDVVTLDIEMPRMDGLTALGQIMSECPTPVVMLSSLTGEGTQETIRALQLGATDFFLKDSAARPAGTYETADDFRAKVKQASQVDPAKLHTTHMPRKEHLFSKKKPPQEGIAVNARRVVVIGSSTGGPQALSDVLPALPGDLPALLLVIQHMPPELTKSLANRLNSACEIEVAEACEGEKMRVGKALIAPGGYHMVINEEGYITLTKDKNECGVRPAANVTLESVARRFGSDTLCVILTGMGSDGTRGATLIKSAGGKVFAEDESTCIVYGMPKSIVDAGLADKILPRSQIAPEIVVACNEEGAREIKL